MAGVRGNLDARLAFGLLAITALSLVVAMFTMSAVALASPPKYELKKAFGPDGTELSRFDGAGPVAVDQQSHVVYAGGDNSDKLYKFDGEGNPVAWGGSEPYLSGNELSGLTFPPEGQHQVAVDSSSHTVYVTSGNAIRAFQADGEPSEFIAGPGAGSNTIGVFTQLSGLAVDENGYIYASDRSQGNVRIYSPSGEQVDEFAAGVEPANLAVDTAGAVYVTRFDGTVTKYTASSALPVTSSTTYSSALTPIDPKPSFTVGVDPATNNVYVVHVFDREVTVYTENGAPITSFGEQGDINASGDGIAIDGTGTKVYVDKSEAGLAQVLLFQPQPPAAPKIEIIGVGGISSNAAILNARINPDLVATTYRFEYGRGDCSVSECTSVPVGEVSIGAGNDGVWVSQQIRGLEASTQYHYRVVAKNAIGEDEQSGSFTTQDGSLGSKLSDSRAWEMVSPANKHGALILGPANGFVQASADGNGLAYASIGSVEADPEGNRVAEGASVLGRRESGRWSAKDITTPNVKVTGALVGQQVEYKLFNPDLSKALLEPRSGTPLSPEASERAPYLRENSEPPVFRPLVTGKEGFANVPPEIEFGGGSSRFTSEVNIKTATHDLSHVVLESRVPLAVGGPAPSLYEWVDGQLNPTSVLPASEGGAFVPAEEPGSGTVSVRNAISSDGSRVFWTGSKFPNTHLYVRDNGAGETARIDQVQCGICGAGNEKPVFQTANAAGTVVLFTDTQQLTEDASPSGVDLYRCEIVSVATGCVSLVDLTAPRVGSGESAEVQGLVSGASEDGTRAYFVAKGVLTTGTNQFGQTAVSGQPNLYLWQAGEGVRYIATLESEDRRDWGLIQLEGESEFASTLSAASSPNGRYFAFMSGANLTEQNNLEIPSGNAVERVFRYDAVAERLDCISCAPDGAAPEGAMIENNEVVDPRGNWNGSRVAALLPEATVLHRGGEVVYQPRAVLDNGRVFFNMIGSLVPADSNKQWDVYQYEDLGVGDCAATSGNPDVVRSGEGCVSLISSGTGGTEAGFLDASVTGDDVFFLTPARLAVTDSDNELDIYDARVGGIPAVLTPTAECAGESCHPPASALPELSPSSASFNGAGNVKGGKRCPNGKRKVKRGGRQRCVSKKHAKRHRRAGGHRKGAGR